MVLTWAPMQTFCFFFVREKQALQQKLAEIGRGRNSDGLCWKHLAAHWQVLGASFVSCYAVSAQSAWKLMKPRASYDKDRLDSL